MKVGDGSNSGLTHGAQLEFQTAVGPFDRRQKRKRKPKRKTRSPVTLRLTDEERARLKDLSRGMTVSAYIRRCVFGREAARPKRRSRAPAADEKALARVLALLGASRIANNLNQLAFHSNSGSLIVDDHALAQITEAYDHVTAMRNALVKALGLADGAFR